MINKIVHVIFLISLFIINVNITKGFFNLLFAPYPSSYMLLNITTIYKVIKLLIVVVYLLVYFMSEILCYFLFYGYS